MRILAALLFLLPALPAFGQSADRFPRPEFEKAYTEPTVTQPMQRANWLVWVDVGVLAATLSLASYFGLKKVSRKAIFALTVFSVAYFGFYKEGCVCPIGSIQNIAMGLGPTGYVVPLSVVAIFLLPLLFALFFGRSFCSSVCPLGAAQEMVIIKPIKVPKGIKHFLSLIPYVYLGTGVLLAYVGAEYIICKYDPFVGFYRMGANFGMFAFGAAILAIGTVVARPYCRFLCPYSILLKWTSVFSKWHLKTTPTECIQCRLCEDSCPFDHLHKPTVEKTPEPRSVGVKRLAVLLGSTPLIIAAGIGLGYLAHIPLSRVHHRVALAERVALEKAGLVEGTTDMSQNFYESTTSIEALMLEGNEIRNRVRSGSMLLGAFIGLVVACKLIALSVQRKRTDYEPDRGDCYSCARCSDACSVGRVPGVAVGTMRVELKFGQTAQVSGGHRSP